MTLNPDFTLSEEELAVVREAIRQTMAEFLANQKWINGLEQGYVLQV